MTFIFYDTETTGLERGYDQILQFAAIATNDDFQVLEEVDWRCRPWPHILPSPGALMVTGVKYSDALRAPQSHYEMMRMIVSLYEKHSPAVSVGFNSISFDENMLRHGFYQTLNPIYTTNTNGNSRMDVMHLAHAVHEYHPGVLKVPTNDRGNLTFKLELLAKENGLLHELAHDALSDTRATMELARLIRTKTPEVWSSLYKTRSKSETVQMIADNPVFLYTRRGFARPTIPTTPIAKNPGYDAELAVFDLTLDPSEIVNTKAEDIAGLTDGKDRAIRLLKTNANPILHPCDQHLQTLGLSREQAEERARIVQSHPTFSKYVSEYLSGRYAGAEAPERVEDMIYEGFYSNTDERRISEFHRVTWAERYKISQTFEDDRLKQLGRRLVYSESPQDLPDDIRDRFETEVRRRLQSGDDVPWTTIASARDEVTELQDGASDAHKDILSDYEAVLDKRILA